MQPERASTAAVQNNLISPAISQSARNTRRRRHQPGVIDYDVAPQHIDITNDAVLDPGHFKVRPRADPNPAGVTD